jgi:hypothetical protein
MLQLTLWKAKSLNKCGSWVWKATTEIKSFKIKVFQNLTILNDKLNSQFPLHFSLHL